MHLYIEMGKRAGSVRVNEWYWAYYGAGAQWIPYCNINIGKAVEMNNLFLFIAHSMFFVSFQYRYIFLAECDIVVSLVLT